MDGMVDSLQKAADYCGCSAHTIWRRIQRGAFPEPLYTIGSGPKKRRLWTPSSLEEIREEIQAKKKQYRPQESV